MKGSDRSIHAYELSESGKSLDEIATSLGVQVSTARFHVKNGKRALAIRNSWHATLHHTIANPLRYAGFTSAAQVKDALFNGGIRVGLLSKRNDLPPLELTFGKQGMMTLCAWLELTPAETRSMLPMSPAEQAVSAYNAGASLFDALKVIGMQDHVLRAGDLMANLDDNSFERFMKDIRELRRTCAIR